MLPLILHEDMLVVLAIHATFLAALPNMLVTSFSGWAGPLVPCVAIVSLTSVRSLLPRALL